MGYQQEFIEFMVRSGVLTFGDFVTKSGRKTPYFINTGNYKTAQQISKLGDYYAACIKNAVSVQDQKTVLYGPAYKGIPLAVTSAIALYRNYGINVPYCFNRKEAKDHGEGGNIIGYKLQDKDQVIVIEDVITAGASVRETVPILKAAADVEIKALIISVDRMEKGTQDKTAIEEIKEEFGIQTYPIVTIRDVVDHLYGREVDGKVVIDDQMKARIEAHLEQYAK